MAKAKRKRGNAEGSVYPTTRTKTRKDGTTQTTTVYRGFVTIGVIAGKQQRKYISAPTKSEANTKIRDLQNRVAEGTLTTTSSPTVQEWLAHYLKHLAPKKNIKGRKGNAKSTLATYKNFAKNWIYPHLGTVKLEKLKVEQLEALYEAMADEGLSTSAIEQVHAILRTSLETAYKRGRMPRNVARLATRPAGAAAKDVRLSTLAEARAVLDAALSRPQAARWVMRLAYALRTGEILGLSWADVDFDAGVVHIRRQLQRETAEHGCGDPVGTEPVPVRPKHGCGDVLRYEETGSQGRKLLKPRPVYPCGLHQPAKCPEATSTVGEDERDIYPCGKAQAARCPDGTGGGLTLVDVKTRTSQAPLPLPAPIAEILKKRKAEQRRARIQEGPRWRAWEYNGQHPDLIFTQDNGRPVDPRQDYDDWTDLLMAADVEWVNPHAARHWGASILVSLGVHPRTAMEMLRHADVSTTLNLYAKAPSDDLRAAAEAMAKALLGKAIGE